MADINAIAEQIQGLTLLEASQLVKVLEERLGVSAAAASVAVGAAPAAAAAARSPGKPAAAAAPTKPQAKDCDPACDSTSYCLKGQCVDNGLKPKTPESTSPKPR